MEPGDALLVRMGWFKRRLERGPQPVPDRPGLHAACLPWLHQRGVAVLAADASHDILPVTYPTIRWPIHIVGVVAMGLWLIDAANLEDLTRTCRQLKQWEFMFTLAPLRLPTATGSPVNPLAVF